MFDQISLNPRLLVIAAAATLLVTGYALTDRAQALADHNSLRVTVDDALLVSVMPPVGMAVAIQDRP